MRKIMHRVVMWAYLGTGPFLIVAGTLLEGCANARQYEAAVEEATKEAKDIEAAALENAPCLIGLGAWSRMNDDRMRTAVFALCVPDAERFNVTLATD